MPFYRLRRRKSTVERMGGKLSNIDEYTNWNLFQVTRDHRGEGELARS